MTKETPEVEKTEVAIKDTNSAIAVSDTSVFDMMSADSGAGMENITQEFMQTPMLRILQNQSKELIKVDPRYITGAKAGQIVNTLDQTLYNADIDDDKAQGIFAVAVYFQVKHIEWFKQTSKAGQGIVKVWDTDDYRTDPDYVLDKETGRYNSKDGEREITQNCETFILYKTSLDDLEVKPAVISMTGMQFKKARAWNTGRSMRRVTNTKTGKSFVPPSWYGVYQLRAKQEANSKGQWHGWELKLINDIDKVPNGGDWYAEAKLMHEGITKGTIRAADTDLEEVRSEGGASTATYAPEDVPF